MASCRNAALYSLPWLNIPRKGITERCRTLERLLDRCCRGCRHLGLNQNSAGFRANWFSDLSYIDQSYFLFVLLQHYLLHTWNKWHLEPWKAILNICGRTSVWFSYVPQSSPTFFDLCPNNFKYVCKTKLKVLYVQIFLWYVVLWFFALCSRYWGRYQTGKTKQKHKTKPQTNKKPHHKPTHQKNPTKPKRKTHTRKKQRFQLWIKFGMVSLSPQQPPLIHFI